MVCQKRKFLKKIISQPLCKNASFSTKRLRRVTRKSREIQGATRRYKGLQGIAKGYNGLEGVAGEREIWKRNCQKTTYSNQLLCQIGKEKTFLKSKNPCSPTKR